LKVLFLPLLLLQGVINSTANTPGILIRIKNIDGTTQIVCDLTVDLARARPGEIIKSAKFNQSSVFPYARSHADFFQDCIVLPDHVYISYSYKD
jgi:hypothetical protein